MERKWEEWMFGMASGNGVATCSPQLFIMALNAIIFGLQCSDLGFRNEYVYVPALFFADN